MTSAVINVLTVRLLGAVEIVVDGAARSVAGIRRKAVVAALALNAGEAVSVDRLVDQVWSGDAPSTAVNTLQSHISYLRREFGLGGWIVARAPGYVLDLRDEPTDAQYAQRLVQQARQTGDPVSASALLRTTLDLWRGGSIEDLAELPAFASAARQLDGLRWTARRLHAEAKLASGEDASAVEDLINLVGHFTLDEDLHRHLMMALYRTGRQGEALAVYRKLRRRLNQELGVDPIPKLDDLYAAILRHDPGLQAARRQRLTVGADSPHESVGADGLAAAGDARMQVLPRLFERDRELAVLRGSFARVGKQAPGEALIWEGPAGVGRTALLAYARHEAEMNGFAVGAVKGIERDRDHEWGQVRELFADMVFDAGGEEFWAARGCGSAFRLLTGQDAVSCEAGSEPLLLRSLWRSVVELSMPKPLAIIVDDLQWCDAMSLRFFAYLAARVERLQVVFIGGKRRGTVGEGEAGASLAWCPASVRGVRALSAAGTCELLNAAMGTQVEPAVASRSYGVIRGNPLLATELARAMTSIPVADQLALLDVGAPGLSPSLEAELAALPALTSKLVRAIAVAGTCSLDDLAVLCGLPAETAVAGLGPLQGANLASVTECSAQFSLLYPLSAMAIRQSMSVIERAVLHLRLRDMRARNGSKTISGSLFSRPGVSVAA